MKKIIRFLSLLGALIMLLGTVSAFAMTPYTTYTYSMDGFIAYSPDAYTPDRVLDYQAMQLDSVLNDPRDMFVDQDTNYVYLADTKNNRIVVLNQYLQFVRSISNFVNDQGVPDGFTNPSGVFANAKEIYVCDTDANRIVVFDIDGNFELNADPKSVLEVSYIGFRPHDYLQEQRLRHAKVLLTGSALSIEQIAEQSGFNSASHFSRVFRNREKMTPSKFRSMNF